MIIVDYTPERPVKQEPGCLFITFWTIVLMVVTVAMGHAMLSGLKHALGALLGILP